MSNKPITDAGVGQALFSTRLKLSIQAAGFAFSYGIIPFFILPIIVWSIFVSKPNFDIVKLNIIASVSDDDIARQWRMRDSTGVLKTITAVTSDGLEFDRLRPSQMKKALGRDNLAFGFFGIALLMSFLSAIFGFFLVSYLIKRYGADTVRSRRVRGAFDLSTPNDLNAAVLKNGAGPYKLLDVSIPIKSPMAGILMEGSQGSGKSLPIHDLMGQVFSRKRKSIIYDQSGEFYATYFRPGIDHFFNPACVGSVPWSIFSELKYSYDSSTLAQAFLPIKNPDGQAGANAFFEDAARALFAVILRRLAERGAQNTKDIATAFFEMPDDEMDELIKKSVASSAVGGDSKAQRQGVISSISIYLDGISSVSEGSWSIREFIESDGDARLFIVGSEDTRAMFSPLYRLILSIAASAIAAKQEIVHEDRYWFFLDEAQTLGDFGLDNILALYRKFGVCIVVGIQGESQFEHILGKARAETVLNLFNTVLLLQMNNSSMAEKAALRLNKMDKEIVNQNQALAVTEWRDGAGLNRVEQEKWVVMPAEFLALNSCTGYLKLSGAYGAAFMDYRDWLPTKTNKNARALKFAAVQKLPSRDPRFEIQKATVQDPSKVLEVFSKQVSDVKKGANDADGGLVLM